MQLPFDRTEPRFAAAVSRSARLALRSERGDNFGAGEVAADIEQEARMFLCPFGGNAIAEIEARQTEAIALLPIRLRDSPRRSVDRDHPDKPSSP